MIGPKDDDEAVLRALGALAGSEADDLDARWDALAAGALSPEDVAALEAMAAEDPTAADAWQAFAPRDDDLDAAMAASILAQVALGQAEPPNTSVVAITQAPSARRRWLWIASAGLAVAAGLLMFAMRGGSTLPAYTLDNRAGEQAMRGDEHADAVIYGPGSQIDLILRPAADVTDAVGIRALHRRGDTIALLSIQPTKGATGVFRLRGVVDDILPSSPGAYTLIFVIGAPDALPKTAEAAWSGVTHGAPGWQVLQHQYRRR